jgi:hypothetical protein
VLRGYLASTALLEREHRLAFMFPRFTTFHRPRISQDTLSREWDQEFRLMMLKTHQITKVARIVAIILISI